MKNNHNKKEIIYHPSKPTCSSHSIIQSKVFLIPQTCPPPPTLRPTKPYHGPVPSLSVVFEVDDVSVIIVYVQCGVLTLVRRGQGTFF